MSRPNWICFGLALMALLAAQCALAQQAQPAQMAAQPAPVVEHREARIGNGDLLEISIFSVYGAPDLVEKSRVSNKGELSLPFVGWIHVAGLTEGEAESAIEKAIREGDFIKNPHVSVFIQEYATQGVSVVGEVNKPGIYPVVVPRRLFDIISAAGGLTPRAGRRLYISRRNSSGPATVVDIREENDSAQSNVDVFPGDTVVVSQAGIVYVVGDVRKPGGFVMDNNDSITVVQAIAMAEGLSGSAAVDRAKIIRKKSGGMEEIPLNLRNILATKAPDVSLRNGDVVFVPASAGKRTAHRTLEAILQVATGAAIYRR